MELDCSVQIPGVAIIVHDLKAIGQLITQGSLSTSTCIFTCRLLIDIIIVIIVIIIIC